MKVKVLNFNQVDSVGDIILPQSINKKVWLLKDFDVHRPLGKVKVNSTDDGLEAEIDEEQEGFYPAIGFSILKSHMEGNVRVIEKINLHTVSINEQPNADKTIPPISY